MATFKLRHLADRLPTPPTVQTASRFTIPPFHHEVTHR